jgi:DNA-binding MarR family transcriptional regulator
MKKFSLSAAFLMNLWTMNSSYSKRNDASLGTLHGIGLSEYMVLFRLAEASGKTMRRIDLATSVGMTASGVTRMLAPMEKIGLVEKEASPRDARVSLVKLSDAGARVFRDASASLDANSERMLQGVDHDTLEKLLSVFRTMDEELYISPSTSVVS